MFVLYKIHKHILANQMFHCIIFVKKTISHFDYSLNTLSLTHNDTIKDLGVFFVIYEIRSSKIDFYDSSALKTLYFSLVRSQIEYTTLIWYTDNIGQNTSLCTIQNNFLRYLSYKCNVKESLIWNIISLNFLNNFKFKLFMMKYTDVELPYSNSKKKQFKLLLDKLRRVACNHNR
ncbi:putative RNA-directed DNA polymerase [Aphis craccivora]|uniref:Putative RNA-directed DNA polymerase n=1 Tax=Aphis craccivora TaxID=307492 RepID=A0A6G0ZRT4_APHCR|nr:putative RNA-directed DNA polymerase [Aphis craccivora]